MADYDIPSADYPKDNLRISRAIELVYNYVRNHLDKTDTHVTFRIDEVYPVWFCFILGNWKALISTTLPDGMYYEVTYDKTNKCYYLDAYKKFENVKIVDEPFLNPIVKLSQLSEEVEKAESKYREKTQPEVPDYEVGSGLGGLIPPIPAGEDRFA